MNRREQKMARTMIIMTPHCRWAVTDGSENLLPLVKREGRSKSKFSPPWKSQNSKDGKSSVTGYMQS
jgi:hypothetical protein